MQNGDLVLVKPGVYFLSSPATLDNHTDVWIRAFPHHGAILTSAHQASREGTQTWNSIGDNRWEIPNFSHRPWMMGYENASGTDWTLIHYIDSDLSDHNATFCNGQGNGAILEYGYTFTDGDLRVRLPDNDNPNGKKIVIGSPPFAGFGITMSNSDRIIFDGLVCEGFGNRCIDGATSSTDITVRNVEANYTQTILESGNNATITNTRYQYPGFDLYKTATDALGGDVAWRRTWNLVKSYPEGDCLSNQNMEGSIFYTTAPNISNVTITKSFMMGMDGFRMNGLNNSTVSNSICFNYGDNCIEFESDNDDGGDDNRATGNYIRNWGYEPISLQENSGVQGQIDAIMDHNVIIYDNAAAQETIHDLIKDNIVNAGAFFGFYNNTVFLRNKGIFSRNGTGTVDGRLILRNNILFQSITTSLGNFSATTSNNYLVRSSDVNWITSNNGIHATSTASLNFTNESTDLGIEAGSTAIDQGIVIPGITGASGVDIGAFELADNPTGPLASAWPVGAPSKDTIVIDSSVPTGWTGDVPPVVSGAIFVSPSGSGSSCTTNSPCSLSTGLGQAGSNDTVVFKNGTYSWFDTPANNVTFLAENLHLAIIEYDSATSHTGGVYAVGIRHNNAIIDGLRITGGCVNAGDNCGGGSGHGLIRVFASSGLIVRNSIVEKSRGSLINVCGSHSSNCSDVLIENNILRDSAYLPGSGGVGGEGVYIGQFQGLNTVTNVRVTKNTFQGIGCEQALDVKPGGVNVEADLNIFETQSLRSGNGCAFDVDGVMVSQGELNFHHNIIRTNTLAESVLRPAEDGGLVQDNVVYGNTHTGSLIRPRTGGSGPATEISDNVFCSNSNTTISGSFNVHDNTFASGTPSPGCIAKENEILALIAGDDPPPGDDDIVSDLISHLQFDNAITDSAGPTLWTHSGTPSFETGQIGNALSLDGTEHLLANVHSISGTSLFPASGNPFSVSVWVKTLVSGTGGTPVASAVSDPLQRDFQIAVTSTDVDVYMRGSATTGLPAANDGNWHHIVVTWDGSVGRTYLDNVLVANNMSVGSSSEDTGELITIGSRTGGTGFLFTGALDDVRIYARSLDPAAVDVLFNLTQSTDTNPPTTPGVFQTAQISSSQINYSWTASIGDPVGEPITYHLEVCEGGACSNFVEIAVVTGLQFQHTGLSPGTTYRSRLRAADDASPKNFSAFTAIVSQTTMAAASRAERGGGWREGGWYQ